MNYSLQVGVKVVLKDEQGRILLLKRSQDKYKNVKDTWDIPGGRINAETGLIENLKREVSEETGMALDPESLKLLGAQDIFHGENSHVVRITYEGKVSGETILSDEHSEFKWLSKNDTLKIDGLDKYLKEILENNF
ncbi:MAG TPA: NUDIX hydrolase [Candidatus Paceibacterota bacterium]